eukprot:2951402-Rhodomonas_salina.4
MGQLPPAACLRIQVRSSADIANAASSSYNLRGTGSGSHSSPGVAPAATTPQQVASPVSRYAITTSCFGADIVPVGNRLRPMKDTTS